MDVEFIALLFNRSVQNPQPTGNKPLSAKVVTFRLDDQEYIET